MFKIFAVICFINAGSLEQNLCFKSQAPLDFNSKKECQIALDGLINYLNEDMKERQISLVMICKKYYNQQINI